MAAFVSSNQYVRDLRSQIRYSSSRARRRSSAASAAPGTAASSIACKECGFQLIEHKYHLDIEYLYLRSDGCCAARTCSS